MYVILILHQRYFYLNVLLQYYLLLASSTSTYLLANITSLVQSIPGPALLFCCNLCPTSVVIFWSYSISPALRYPISTPLTSLLKVQTFPSVTYWSEITRAESIYLKPGYQSQQNIEILTFSHLTCFLITLVILSSPTHSFSLPLYLYDS